MTADEKTAADQQLQQRATSEAEGKRSHYYYTMKPQAQVVGASAERNEITVALGDCGGMDEGVLATAADFWTSVVISATNGGRQSVTTSLAVQTLGQMGSLAVHVVCRAANGHAVPAASAVFVAASDPSAVYATAAHTKAWARQR
ncbi:hypothetical protein EV175_000281 [Coemansia sp. RSA 1933]|nr:hypothetical protein EV175_000281 [Coemansia sp. RSA 1933]